LVDPKNHHYYSVADHVGSVGKSGYASYPEICRFLETNKTTVVFDKPTNVPYAFNGKEWVTFENEHSANDKVKIES